MKQQIINILLKHSSEIKTKTGILSEPDDEDWLWSGEFETVASEIEQMFWNNYYKLEEKSDEFGTIPIPEPTGKFILESNIKGTLTQNGMYFHYSDVCVLLGKYKEKILNDIKKINKNV